MWCSILIWVCVRVLACHMLFHSLFNPFVLVDRLTVSAPNETKKHFVCTQFLRAQKLLWQRQWTSKHANSYMSNNRHKYINALTHAHIHFTWAELRRVKWTNPNENLLCKFFHLNILLVVYASLCLFLCVDCFFVFALRFFFCFCCKQSSTLVLVLIAFDRFSFLFQFLSLLLLLLPLFWRLFDCFH